MTNKLNPSAKELKEHGYSVDVGGGAIDLVCGMDLSYSEHVSKRKSEVYYFCSKNCKDHFDANPEMYVGD